MSDKKIWLGWLNILILQWFFVRLAWYKYDESDEVFYTLWGPVLPLTGWWGRFIPKKIYWRTESTRARKIHDQRINRENDIAVKAYIEKIKNEKSKQ